MNSSTPKVISAIQRRLKVIITVLCLSVRKPLLILPRDAVHNLGVDLNQKGAASHRDTEADDYFIHAIIELVLRWGQMADDARRRGELLSHGEKKACEAYAVFCLRAAEEIEQAPEMDFGALKKFAAQKEGLARMAKIPAVEKDRAQIPGDMEHDAPSRLRAHQLKSVLCRKKAPADLVAKIDAVIAFFERGKDKNAT